MISKHYISKYFQKSTNFLVPLILSNNKYIKNISSYLKSNVHDESIENYNLLIKLEKNIDINDTEFCEHILNIYDYDSFNIYILDLSNYKETVELFIKGKYSQFDDNIKKKILKFWKILKYNGDFYKKNESNNIHYIFYSFLFPKQYIEEVAKEMVNPHKLFENYEEALNTLKNTNELCPPYNKKKETLIIKNGK